MGLRYRDPEFGDPYLGAAAARGTAAAARRPGTQRPAARGRKCARARGIAMPTQNHIPAWFTPAVPFVAGAVAGGTVKTFTAPLSRSTILLQTAGHGSLQKANAAAGSVGRPSADPSGDPSNPSTDPSFPLCRIRPPIRPQISGIRPPIRPIQGVRSEEKESEKEGTSCTRPRSCRIVKASTHAF